MNKKVFLTVMVIAAILTASANADVILSTDFEGRTVNGATAENITWVTNGVTNPGNLTAIGDASYTVTTLFDTTATQGHFAPDSNIGSGEPWSTTFTIDVTGADISLTDVDMTTTHFSNTGNLQTASRDSKWTITVNGTNSAPVSQETIILAPPGTTMNFNIAFDSPITLTASESYSITIAASKGTYAGINAGIDAISFNGTVVPEPATMTLLAIGGLSLLRRRRNG